MRVESKCSHPEEKPFTFRLGLGLPSFQGRQQNLVKPPPPPPHTGGVVFKLEIPSELSAQISLMPIAGAWVIPIALARKRVRHGWWSPLSRCVAGGKGFAGAPARGGCGSAANGMGLPLRGGALCIHDTDTSSWVLILGGLA